MALSLKDFVGNAWGNSRQTSSPFDVTPACATSDVYCSACVNSTALMPEANVVHLCRGDEYETFHHRVAQGRCRTRPPGKPHCELLRLDRQQLGELPDIVLDQFDSGECFVSNRFRNDPTRTSARCSLQRATDSSSFLT